MHSTPASSAARKLTSAAFSGFVKDVYDLYVAAVRNGYYMPKESSSAVNEVMVYQVLQKAYWCPKYEELKLRPCVKAPIKNVLVGKVLSLCTTLGHNVSWIDEQHSPDSKWLVDVIATLNPSDEIFRKDYVPPPVRRRLQDVETIVLPNEIFEGLPQSKSKAKSRRLKIVSEAFAQEKATRLKEIRRTIDQEILQQEIRVDELKQRKQPKRMSAAEEEKGEARNFFSDHIDDYTTPKKVNAFATPYGSAM